MSIQPEYLHWDEKTIADFSPENIADLYDRGYVFTRKGHGVMQQTRSVRVNLEKFGLSSENRRILKKVGEMENPRMEIKEISLPYGNYDWHIGKQAKDFYEIKFGPGIFSAQKTKQILTGSTSNFNLLFKYSDIGFAICYKDKKILHYSYPFYDLEKAPKDMGLGMMIQAVQWAKEKGLKYVYLGSLQRPGDAYKLQFTGMEWYGGGPEGKGIWQTDLDAAKEILKKI